MRKLVCLALLCLAAGADCAIQELQLPQAVLSDDASLAGAWLRPQSGDSIICTLPDGRRIAARIFRLNGCFGRGLILTREIIDVRAKDILSVN